MPSTLPTVCNEGRAANFHGRWSSGQQATQSASRFSAQAHPEGDGDKPSRCSDLTGRGICAVEVGLNMSFCNEMRTINQHCRWRSREVRVLRQQELSFFPERWTTPESCCPDAASMMDGSLNNARLSASRQLDRVGVVELEANC